MADANPICIAFVGSRHLGTGSLADVAILARRAFDELDPVPILTFDATTSEPIELDLRGSVDQIAARYRAPEPAPPPKRPVGRPRLGVVAREVTLLPRQWDWLSRQPGGASVTLRKLVDQARTSTAPAARRRQLEESAYRFMVALAGNEPGFEEATRALFAGAADGYAEATASWPADVRDHARGLAGAVFTERADKNTVHASAR